MMPIENGRRGARGSKDYSAQPSLSICPISLCHISSLLAPSRDWKWRLPLNPYNLGPRLILSTTSNKSRSKQSWQSHSRSQLKT
ncbi:hypothetical protein BT93_H1436 [Corymbia citriodora subsp. variegata]|nr:hypothetical protein BT93_H1436 [Corymbia citriodora subsp. variegata]